MRLFLTAKKSRLFSTPLILLLAGATDASLKQDTVRSTYGSCVQFAQLIVPKEIPKPREPEVGPTPSSPAAPAPDARVTPDPQKVITATTVEEELPGEWKGVWTNRGRAMPFTLRITLADDNSLKAEGKAETWSLTERFKGALNGNTLTLTGTDVLPPPPPEKRYSLDTLTLTLSQDGLTLEGSWIDQENSRGTVAVQRLDASLIGSSPTGPWARVVADANQAIDSAVRTGSTKGFLSQVPPAELGEWGRAAESGVPEANWLIGCCYENGIGVPSPDPHLAFQYYSRAADKEYGPALNDIGRCYARGSGCEQDMTKAVQYYQRAANRGRAAAWFNLGTCYEKSLGGLTKDPTKAAECYARAKSLGYKMAEKALERIGH